MDPCKGYSSQVMEGPFFLIILEECCKVSLKTVVLIHAKVEVYV